MLTWVYKSVSGEGRALERAKRMRMNAGDGLDPSLVFDCKIVALGNVHDHENFL